MITALLGKKLSMTQFWDSAGICHAVTVIETGPCQIVQVKTADGKDGYDAVQIGFDEFKVRNEGKGDSRANKPTNGHFKKHDAIPQRIVREVPAADPKSPPAPGTTVKVDEVFKDGEKVDQGLPWDMCVVIPFIPSFVRHLSSRPSFHRMPSSFFLRLESKRRG